jgi:hypothetical protein
MLSSLVDIYNMIPKHERNKFMYEMFESHVKKDEELLSSFEKCEGFGETPFSYNWKLLVDEMPNNFKFLEIGVYKGRVCAQVSMLAKRLGKEHSIFGITPLSTSGDKYSRYENDDFKAAIYKSFDTCKADKSKLTILHGFSQDPSIITEASKHAQYDIIFIDGCHDYEVVCQDIKNYLPLLKSGGYLVMDDCAKFIEHPYGRFHGHPDVSRATQELLDNNKDLTYYFAIGHNRLWRKN